MAGSAKPPVEERIPPALLLRIGNPVVKAVLRSPLHRLLDKHVALLTITGRCAGRASSASGFTSTACPASKS